MYLSFVTRSCMCTGFLELWEESWEAKWENPVARA